MTYFSVNFLSIIDNFPSQTCLVYADEVLQKIRDAGFEVAMQKEMQLTKEMAEDFYKEHQGQEYFEELTTRMSRSILIET